VAYLHRESVGEYWQERMTILCVDISASVSFSATYKPPPFASKKLCFGDRCPPGAPARLEFYGVQAIFSKLSGICCLDLHVAINMMH